MIDARSALVEALPLPTLEEGMRLIKRLTLDSRAVT
jgi:hypothetical protein